MFELAGGGLVLGFPIGFVIAIITLGMVNEALDQMRTSGESSRDEGLLEAACICAIVAIMLGIMAIIILLILAAGIGILYNIMPGFH